MKRLIFYVNMELKNQRESKWKIDSNRGDGSKTSGRFGTNQKFSFVGRCFLDSGEIFDDGSHIIYVNGSYRDETPIGKLMHDFSCKNPSELYYSLLADRTRFFKESKEGIAVMCKAMEDMRNQAVKENMIETALRMLKSGRLDLKDIAAFSGLSIEEVENLKAGKTA